MLSGDHDDGRPARWARAETVERFTGEGVKAVNMRAAPAMRGSPASCQIDGGSIRDAKLHPIACEQMSIHTKRSPVVGTQSASDSTQHSPSQ